jgi:8-oxo-dGTP diphosphatase
MTGKSPLSNRLKEELPSKTEPPDLLPSACCYKLAMFSLGAFAIIFDDHRRVLLCYRRDIGRWNLPGGRVEPGELPTEAAIRETLEETGLEVEIDRLSGVYSKPQDNDLVFAFVCREIGGQLRVTDEAMESRYFDLDDLPAQTIPKHIERIQDAIAHWGEPIFRHQP